MLIARIIVAIEGPSKFTEQEAKQFCEDIDIDGQELNDRILAVIVDHCYKHCPKIADSLKYSVE